MLKKITFCFLAALLICSFTIFAFAAEYQFLLSDAILDFNDLTLGSSEWASGSCYYSFSDPLYDGNNSAEIVGVNIQFYSEGNSLTASLYTSSGVFSPVDTPDLTAYGGICTVTASEGISYDQAVDMFMTVFGNQAYAGTPPVHAGLFETFSTVFGWIVGVLVSIVSLFWANGYLTFFGIFAIVALGIGLFLLIAHLISNFLQFRS